MNTDTENPSHEHTPGELANRTIRDFGEQWTTFDNTDGYFGSTELLVDFVKPFDASEFMGKRVADIGAGTGRFVAGLLDLGVETVYAIEPSKAVDVIRRRFASDPRVKILNIRGDALPSDSQLDCVISIGVVHHIPEPEPVIRAGYDALKPGGRMIVWLYGKEGNRLYLTIAMPLRRVASLLPSSWVQRLAWLLDWPLCAYIALCRLIGSGLPLGQYMTDVLGKLTADKRRLVIYDQLRPAYAKYYSRADADQLMRSAPFDVELHHRMGYSWVAIGTKPMGGNEK